MLLRIAPDTTVEDITISTVTRNEAVIRWQERGPRSVEVELVCQGGARILPSNVQTFFHSAVRYQRAYLTGLTPNTRYSLRFVSKTEQSWAEVERIFSTLPNPKGKCLARIALISDPHLTRKRTYRKGRLLGASFKIFKEVIQTIEREKHDVVVIPGDVADDGNEEVAYFHAKDCLAGFDGKSLILPGNRDNPRSMGSHFPETLRPQVLQIHGWTLVGLDTSTGKVGQDTQLWLRNLLASKETERMLIFSHFALAQHTGAQPGQVVANEDSLQECMGMSNRIYGVFSGHRNAVFVDRSQKTAHVTCPQIVHYPCAWNAIELYPDGFLCWTREIEDIRLIDLSRCEGNRWLSPEWAAQRIGKPDHRSFGHFPWS